MERLFSGDLSGEDLSSVQPCTDPACGLVIPKDILGIIDCGEEHPPNHIERSIGKRVAIDNEQEEHQEDKLKNGIGTEYSFHIAAAALSVDAEA